MSTHHQSDKHVVWIMSVNAERWRDIMYDPDDRIAFASISTTIVEENAQKPLIEGYVSLKEKYPRKVLKEILGEDTHIERIRRQHLQQAIDYQFFRKSEDFWQYTAPIKEKLI